MLRRIVGSMRDDVTWGWRKLHHEELHDLFCISNIIRVIKSRSLRWAGHMVCVRKKRKAHRVLVGKPVGKRLLGKIGIKAEAPMACHKLPSPFYAAGLYHPYCPLDMQFAPTLKPDAVLHKLSPLVPTLQMLPHHQKRWISNLSHSVQKNELYNCKCPSLIKPCQ